MARRKLSKEERLLRKRDYYRIWRIANRDKVNKATADWRKRNPDKALITGRDWKKHNPAAHAAINAKRRASLMQRTVKWADERLIRALYAEAAQLTIETGVLHHVDHIIPLQAELCSGLHVHNNLQILPAQDNLAKGNRYIPETWRENETTEPAPRLTKSEADVLYELTTRGRLAP